MGYIEMILLGALAVAGIAIKEVIKLECDIRRIEKERLEKWEKSQNDYLKTSAEKSKESGL